MTHTKGGRMKLATMRIIVTLEDARNEYDRALQEALDSDAPDTHIAQAAKISRQTVWRWRKGGKRGRQ